MVRSIFALLAVAVCVAPVAAFAANDGSISFKGGCAAKNSGSCTLAVDGQGVKTKIYASSAPDGKFGAVTHTFDASSATTKRINNSSNNSCFYAKSPDHNRTRMICTK